MSMSPIPFLFLALTLAVTAGPQRTWTQAATKKTIVAEITDKTSDNTKAMLVTEEEKTVWVKTADLIESDQVYIKRWVQPDEHLSARVIGSSQGRKKLRVTLRAGSQDMKVVAWRWPGDKKPLRWNLKAGEEQEHEFEGSPKYHIKAWWGKLLVDEETEGKKTGL